jgi:hypothetical protein
MQRRARYEDISHFRAPFKDSMFSGFGIYENVPRGAETHGTGEYMPVSGIGEYVPVSGFGADAAVPGSVPIAPTAEPLPAGAQPAPASAPMTPGPLFESEGHLIFTTPQGAAMVDGMLSPWANTPTAQAMTLANGDIGVLWYVGYQTPPPEAGPASSFVPFASIMPAFVKGYVVLTETSLMGAGPQPQKLTMLITKNPKTVADQAKEGGLYFITRGGDQNVIDSAKRLLGGGVFASFASMGPLGTAALVVGGVAVLYFVFGGKKKKAA